MSRSDEWDRVLFVDQVLVPHQLAAVLVDDGDLVHPHDAGTHEAWISGWLDDAARLGARRARVIAGKASSAPDRIPASGRRHARLASRPPEVRVVTENWLALTPDATSVG